jgi:DNA-damage-inducible protein D
MDNFAQVTRILPNGKEIIDIKLSRFACYLTVMNGDVKKPAIALAQVYFAQLAGAVQDYLSESDKIERLAVRSDVSEREKTLAGVVKKAGISNYAYFQNAGYRGMYNMSISTLRSRRNIDSGRSPIDYMDKDELAANLFRMTQTELKIKQNNITGQTRLEATAEIVGKQVRKTMIEISGVAPEHLPKVEDINVVKKQFKETNKAIQKIDKKSKK